MNCAECEKEIPEKRLRALALLRDGVLPEIVLCIQCQEKRDRHLGTKDVFDSLANQEWEW